MGDTNILIYNVKQNRIFALFHCLGCLLFLLIGFTIYFLADYLSIQGLSDCFISPLFYKIVGLACVLFFGVGCLPFVIKTLIYPKVIFAATNESFYYADNYSNVGFWVRWNEVEELELLTVHKVHFIGFSLKNKDKVEKIVKHYSFFAKYLVNTNKSFSGFDFSLSFTCTGADIKQIYEFMKQKCEENFEKTD